MMVERIVKVVLVVVCLSFPSISMCQDSTVFIQEKKNKIYLEALGKSVGLTINYERNIFSKKSYILTGLVGFSYSKVFDADNIFSVGSNLVLRSNKKLNIEIGLSTSFLVNYNAGFENEEFKSNAINGLIYCYPPLTLFSSLNTGIRYNFENDWFFKLTYSPSIYRRIKYCTEPFLIKFWGGLSVGKSF